MMFPLINPSSDGGDLAPDHIGEPCNIGGPPAGWPGKPRETFTN
jgi:hypothetical protein